MTKHFERELERLKRSIIALGTTVEESLHKAGKAVAERDIALAAQVIEGDDAIDQTEVEIEEECLKVLALYQPVATDLRFIVAVLKINNDLERIADLSVNIAQRAQGLARLPRPSEAHDFHAMFAAVKEMLRNSLRSLVSLDAVQAETVCRADDQVDAMHRAVYTKVSDQMRQHPGEIEAWTNLLSVSRNLERIADHATNIAEDVVYMTSGEIVRHRGRPAGG